MLKEKLSEKIISFLLKYRVKKIAIFGSYIRGDYKPDSDIDIIVEFPEGISLLDHVKIERELSEELGIKVDLVTEKSISPYLREKILREMEVIYG
ncbi:MAG: nucleotidyltransferase family protein [Candidatus Helarchaeota archaeon]